METIIIPMIVSIVYGLIEIIKLSFPSDKINSLLPAISAGIGIILGIIAYFSIPSLLTNLNILQAIFMGMCSGLSATGSNQLIKQIQEYKNSINK